MKRGLIFLLAVLLSTLGPSFPFANASSGDDCGFGKTLSYDTNSDGSTALVCTPITWDLTDTSDAFSHSFILDIRADEIGGTVYVDSLYHLTLECNSKKLSVVVSSAPLDLYPNSNLQGVGSASVKYDNGKVGTFSYHDLQNFSGFYFLTPQVFTQSLITAKSTVALKVNTLDGPDVMTFPIADLASYISKFSSAGCSLGKVVAIAPKKTSKSTNTKGTVVSPTPKPTSAAPQQGSYTPFGYPQAGGSVEGFAFQVHNSGQHCNPSDPNIQGCGQWLMASQNACSDIEVTFGWGSSANNILGTEVQHFRAMASSAQQIEGDTDNPNLRGQQAWVLSAKCNDPKG